MTGICMHAECLHAHLLCLHTSVMHAGHACAAACDSIRRCTMCETCRHPLDQQNTRLLRLLPGLEGLIKGLIGGAGETVLLLENMGSSILVGPDQVWPCDWNALDAVRHQTSLVQTSSRVDVSSSSLVCSGPNAVCGTILDVQQHVLLPDDPNAGCV
jgi:hypothetical protein